ncbi:MULTISPECIES: hypothetical protein [Thermus]|jgi:hypothetical protein|uniref:Uncharacterized protein n=1 Tax=Thermus scotoductus TaxID=37636 RepID=A0A430VCD3_THESC|nr:hypothetical protein [Thermus scotoductus]RTG98420.1 hypothetical protein CSW49_00990 [Thermus scotoductus]RTH01395.1 hypothetical protein CSW45_10175 [Thermus scotoductus]RTH15810.1 hypothetical protein CSW42_14235 [Thermus scotoductus]RTI02471.1 hypothetical protein CSW28_01735 [Thermus scotoductus]RTI05635.1 hypothetical protein CSW30_11160 [Thermus scotoductus]
MTVHPAVYVYRYFFAGEEAGEGRLEVRPQPEGGMKATLTAEVNLPLPKTRQRWQTETDAEGFSLYFAERVEGRESRVFTVERLEEEGVVLVTQGKESVAFPLLSPYHDPLSLILALPRLDLAPGEVVRFAMPGGRVYVERLPDLEVEGRLRRHFRLRPGLTLVQVEEGLPVRMAQQVGDHVFEAVLEGVEAEPKRRRRWV